MRSFFTLVFSSIIGFFAMATNHQIAVGGSLGNSFSPSSITIAQGDTITWTNGGGFHNINGNQATYASNPESFGNGGAASSSWTYQYVFNTPGSYTYQCDPHAGQNMVGTIQVNAAPAASPLNPGDIVFAGFQADAPDGFAIIPMVDLPGNIEIKFTDRSWGPSSQNGGTFDWYSPTAEDTMIWTTPAAGVVAGTYIRFEAPASGSNMLVFGAGGITSDALTGISGSGDNIFCLTGSMNNPTFIAGIMTPPSSNNQTTWMTTGNALSTISYLAPGLVDGVSAFVFASAHIDNGYYNCAISAADTATLRAAIYNQTNWVTDNDPSVAGATNWPLCNLTFTTGPINSIVSFITQDFSVLEDAGTVQIDLSIIPPATSAGTVTVRLTAGIGLDTADGSTVPAFDLVTGDILLPVVAGQDSLSIDLIITDDTLVESNETGTFTIENLTSGLTAGNDTVVVATIIDNDFISLGCSDLFFSEYIEGSGNNKGLEIYNPTAVAIDLTPYLVIESGNGGSFTDTLNLSGTIAAGATYILCTDQADATMQAVADTVLGFPSVSHFNGNDALILWNGTDTIDIIGEVGVDPGTGSGGGWTVGTGSTIDNTLVRKIGVQSGVNNWLISSTQWDAYPQNTFGFFGSHTMNPCGNTNPTLGFSSGTLTVNEADGTVTVDVLIGSPDPNSSTSVQVVVTGGSANNPADYTFSSPTTVAFPAGSSTPQTITIGIIDDMISDGTKTVDFALQNPTNNAVIVGGTFFLVIQDDDIVIPAYSIGDVTANNSVGEPDSLNVYCSIEGVVYGENLRPSGLQFTLNDGSDGIHIFSGGAISNYTVTEGDELRVYGEIAFFNGLTQMDADSVVVLSQGNTLAAPTVVTFLDETTESELLEIKNLTIVDPTQWTGSGSGFNVDVTDGISTYQMRIDNDVDLYSMPAPTVTFHLIGIGGQFDSSSPYDSGYQILPRYSADIIPTIGINEFEESIQLYPNPVVGKFTVDLGTLEKVSISITSIDGTVIYEGTVNSGDQIDAQGWASGVYFATLQNDQYSTTVRLVKNK